MSKESIVFTVGILVLVVPYLGIPTVWKTYFFMVAGIVLTLIGYSLRRAAYIRSIEKANGERRADSFVENGG